MNIGFDIDGVLYPWHEKVHRDMVSKGHITNTFDKFWDKCWLEMKDTNETLFMNYVNDPLMYSTSPPYFGTEELLYKLKRQGHLIWYITQRPKHLDFVTKSWVRRWRLPYEENLIRVDTSKKLPVIENNIDLFIEDAIRHAEELDGFTKVILVKRPYNKDIQDDFTTINNLTELPEYIDAMVFHQSRKE